MDVVSIYTNLNPHNLELSHDVAQKQKLKCFYAGANLGRRNQHLATILPERNARKKKVKLF